MQIVSFYCSKGRFETKRLNHVFGNKFKYTNILEAQFPSDMYSEKSEINDWFRLIF